MSLYLSDLQILFLTKKILQLSKFCQFFRSKQVSLVRKCNPKLLTLIFTFEFAFCIEWPILNELSYLRNSEDPRPPPPGNPLFSPERRGRGGDGDNLQSSNGEILGKGRASTLRVFGEYSPQIPLIQGRGRGTYSFSFEENSRTGIV